MAWQGEDDRDTVQARQIMAELDAVGNTTKAITKGVAIGSAVIAAVALFGSFLVDVSRAAALIVEEVRQQFKLGVLEGKAAPDYTQAVAISTGAAQQELRPLALLGVLTPILVGLVLKAEALGGFLAGIILSGQLLAVFMNNAGGAWDNAKKTIEDEPANPSANTGKGSERHLAGVVGHTVGDPMKDTAGPALNPMLKVVNLVSVIIAPIVVQYEQLGAAGWLIVLGLVGLLVWAIGQSKRPAPELKLAEPPAMD